MSRKNPRTVMLNTDFESDLSPDSLPFSEYPRPQLKRDSYMCLNGLWDFVIENNGDITYSGKILVPFAPESRISGVMREIKKDDLLVYERKFILSEGFLKSKLLLHFGACDQYAEVFVNGVPVGKNVGGYLPFSFEISEYLTSGENILRVVASDPLDTELPYGKQTNRRGGMWYTKVSGIWQTVWLESVPEGYIENIKITPDLCGVDIEILGGASEKSLLFEGNEYSFCGNKYRIDIEKPICWTPETPHLYNIAVLSGDDRVETYFGLRTVEIKQVNGNPLICLNGEPIFMHGLLDQGYFPDGIFLPASPRGFREDITRMKECGFNMLRKHIKTEPDLFYYYCDVYGMLVLQDFINSGKYSFFVDTALPTVYLRKGVTHKASKRRKEEFLKTAKGIIEQLYNHPSVVYYTVFNEGWGQFEADECYRVLKPLDETRVFDTTSGWFKAKKTDVESEHIYFRPIKLKASDKPLVLSEFGGYSQKIENHTFNLDNNYGYRTFTDKASLEEAITKLYETEVIPAIDIGLCATVYTQVSDVEDETNGILTYDRRVIKVTPERMKSIASKLYKRFREVNCVKK